MGQVIAYLPSGLQFSARTYLKVKIMNVAFQGMFKIIATQFFLHCLYMFDLASN